ncbi:hypothetical protein BDN72DRAFT_663036 [Pluteus cervinus]|uniref:Uncharacterized protein n=1 Tax=Pluteus cervinus TaxID=181527 RepID=A0ACD3ASF9_9AGAR|nr:hypothetical protein BDN72DRAFT_663036 [Pluteus cervinus]
MASLHRNHGPDTVTLSTIANLTTDDAIHKIDMEIAHLECQIRALRELRNSVLPISRVPTEILLEVFLRCHELDYGRSKSRLVLSWVSRHWRYLVLGHPALWSSIDIFQTDLLGPPSPIVDHLQQCFTRSRNTPLSIAYYGPRSHILSMCSFQIHRIRQLRINHQDTNDEYEPLSDAWQQPAPLLVSLDLIGINLEDISFGGAHPPLRSLLLESCRHFWDSPITSLSTITTLEINRPADRILLAVFIQRLQALPSLRCCRLHACLEFTPTVFDPPIRLPSLEYLSVIDLYRDSTSQFLHCLNTSGISLQVIDELVEASEEDFKGSFQWFKGYQSEFWQDIRYIYVKREIDARAIDSFVVTIGSNHSRQFTFGVDSLWDKFDFDPTIHASGYLQLENVQGMSFDSISVDGLISFGPLPRLGILELRNMEGDFLGWANSSSKGLFPSVTKLKVNGVLYSGFESFIDENKELNLQNLELKA